MIYDLLKKCRSYRRFDSTKKISEETLRSFIEGARFTASAGNLQKLRYKLVADDIGAREVFESLKFAAYLKDWNGPLESERAVAFIIVASECEINTNLAIDLGISAEAICLAAAEESIGSCMFRSFSRERIDKVIGNPSLIPHLVISFGYPSETVSVIDTDGEDIKYYRDENDCHVVPKITADKLIID